MKAHDEQLHIRVPSRLKRFLKKAAEEFDVKESRIVRVALYRIWDDMKAGNFMELHRAIEASRERDEIEGVYARVEGEDFEETFF